MVEKCIKWMVFFGTKSGETYCRVICATNMDNAIKIGEAVQKRETPPAELVGIAPFVESKC